VVVFQSFLILVAFKWCRHIVKKYCQGCDFSKLSDDKTATSCEEQTARGGRRLYPGGERLLPAPSSHREVSSLYPCLAASPRPDGGIVVSRTRCSTALPGKLELLRPCRRCLSHPVRAVGS